MHEFERYIKITEATCRHTDGFRTDGKKWFQLPFPVMRFNVNFPAISHPEVASDADPFTGLFLTDYCKALSRAFNCKVDFHKNQDLESESRERFIIEYSIRLNKNRASIHNEINVLFYKKHESVPPLDSKLPYGHKCTKQFIYNQFFLIYGRMENI